MGEWISIDEKLPAPYAVVLAKGSPYEGESEKLSVAVCDGRGYWAEADTSFGWLNIEDGSLEGSKGFSDLDNVTHWKEIEDLTS